MDADAPEGSEHDDGEKPSGLSSQVLDYYKRFGRHRDLEQFFSLSTVQGDLADPCSTFWRSIKLQPDSDSGGPSALPSAEVCRISISCSVADPQSSQEETPNSEKQEADSPPIISENEPPNFEPEKDEEGQKSDLETSRKSTDLNLDGSAYKLQSPTSSITYQRKLEWDSLADVGYANEGENKVTSSLSTLERMALHQQFSISDEVKDDVSGHPTAYSTPHDEDEKRKKKLKKGLLKKVTKLRQKDVDVMEVNVERDIAPGSINLNLTKHISFNVDPMTGAASVSNPKTVYDVDKNRSISKTADSSGNSQVVEDKEVQTTLPTTTQTKERHKVYTDCIATVPVLVNLDMLKQTRYKGLKYYRTKLNKRKKRNTNLKQPKRTAPNDSHDKIMPTSEVTAGGSQVSETDSFEYMPAHVYQQNKAKSKDSEHSHTTTSNKTSSLDSSGGYTTLSSKQSEHSLTRDLEKSIALINKLIHHRHQDGDLKKKLVKEVVRRLIKTNYRDDETPTEFLSGLSYNSKSLDLAARDKGKYNTTTSTSDGNNSGETSAFRLRKPILRTNKPISTRPTAQTTKIVEETIAQIHASPKTEMIIHTNVSSNTQNVESGQNTRKEKSTSESEPRKTSSEQLYQSYLEALKKEQKYKQQLKNNLKEKLTPSYSPLQGESSLTVKPSSVKDLLKDLTNINASKGGGDSGGPHSNPETHRNWNSPRFRSHSVFTMSSANADRMPIYAGTSRQGRSAKLSIQNEMKSKETEDINVEERNTLPRQSKSNVHYCCCPFHTLKEKRVDSAVQVHVKSSDEDIKKHITLSENLLKSKLPSTSNSKIVCFCSSDKNILNEFPENFMIYKCCKMPEVPTDSAEDEIRKTISTQCSAQDINSVNSGTYGDTHEKKTQSSKSSETLDSIYKENLPSEKNMYRNQPLVKDTAVFRFEHQVTETSPTFGKENTPFPLTRDRKDCRFSEALKNIDKLDNIKFIDSCIQTSLSIDPRISQLNLNDINVIDEIPHKENNGKEVEKTILKSSDVPTTSGYENTRHCYHTLTKFREGAIPKKLKETEIVINEILDAYKSAHSQMSNEYYDDSIFTFLDAEKSEDSPVEFHPDEVIVQNVCSLNPAPSENELQIKPSMCNLNLCATTKLSQNLTSCRPSSKDISTQMTPKNLRSTKVSSLLKENVHSSAGDSEKTSQSKSARDYTADWIEKRNKESVVSEVYHNESTKLKMQDESGKSAKENNSRKSRLKSVKNDTDSSAAKTSEFNSSGTTGKEALIESIEDIIRRYGKNKVIHSEKKKSRHKHYKEILNKLHYLLQTENSGDDVSSMMSVDADRNSKIERETQTKSNSKISSDDEPVKLAIKGSTQLKTDHSSCDMPHNEIIYAATIPKNRVFIKDDTSELPTSTDIPDTSETSFTCHIIGKIKNQCEKYHKRHGKCVCQGTNCEGGCEASSSTSARQHKPDVRHVSRPRCKSCRHSTHDLKKKSIAYNLIIEPSNVLNVKTDAPENSQKPRKLKDVVIKVPSNHKLLSRKLSTSDHVEFKDIHNSMERKTSKSKLHSRAEKTRKNTEQTAHSSKQTTDKYCSEPPVAGPSSANEVRKFKFLTVREYLERNRPDFVNSTSERQRCLRVVSDSRQKHQALRRQFVSLQTVEDKNLDGLTEAELRDMACRLGEEFRKRRPQAKFLNEKEMKEHSKRIYRSLPEVTQKKEKIKRDNMRKTNLIMTSLFKKNLQKRALKGAVDISNYSSIIKI